MKRKKPPMTKVVPVKMSDETYAHLQHVAEKVGEPDSTIIRLVLRAGLKKNRTRRLRNHPPRRSGSQHTTRQHPHPQSRRRPRHLQSKHHTCRWQNECEYYCPPEERPEEACLRIQYSPDLVDEKIIHLRVF